MRLPHLNFPKTRFPAIVTVIAAAMAVTMAASCSSSSPSSSRASTGADSGHGDHGSSHASLIRTDGPGSAPDQVVAGPQGLVGQFVVECRFVRFLADDPIVYPHEPDTSHLHQFFGAYGVDADSDAATLRQSETSCDQPKDTASYWSPTLVVDGAVIEPIRAVAYYRAGPGVDPTTVVPYPPGFMMVAGDASALEPQPVSRVAWTCGTGGQRSTEPLSCQQEASIHLNTLRLVITFPDCWDGEHVRSVDPLRPSDHVIYSAGGACPSAFPVPIPQLQLAIDYPALAASDLETVNLSSGNVYTGHADFWNTWDQDKLSREVEVCIGRQLPCGISG